MGVSAGGGFAAGMLPILRDMNQPLPAGQVLVSPWVDLRMTTPAYKRFAGYVHGQCARACKSARARTCARLTQARPLGVR